MTATPPALQDLMRREVVGVVIEVPAPCGDDILQWRMGFGDPFADRMPTHVTLLLPPPLAASDIDQLGRTLDEIAGRWSPFEVAMGPIGTFRPVSPVVYLQVSAEGEAFHKLERALISAHGHVEREHDFVPHVTLAMNVGDGLLDAAAEALADYSCRWVAGSMSLFRRHTDGRWHRLSRHQFTG